MTQPCSNAPHLAPPSGAVADNGRVTGPYLQPLLDAAAERGVAPAQLAAGAGLPAGVLLSLPESLPARDYIALLDAGARLADDPHFGLHVGEKVRPGTFSAYGMMLLACSDFAQALAQTQRYEQLAHDLGRTRVAIDGLDAVYAWDSHYPQASRHLVESVFAGIRVFGSWLAGRPLTPARVSFAHRSGADAGEYRRILGVTPSFGAAAHAAHFDAAILSLPVPNADVSLYPLLRQHAERLLGERAQGDGVVAQVRAALLRRLSNNGARLPLVAQDLGMSARTLQRKLADAGTSFQAVLDAVRYALAQDYLRQRDLGLVDIAFLLGFQEQSAFTHAFREWSGINPGAWREQAG
ncbi:AraC family transcriptional regulator [Massilia sp. ST3]|uniref:AraC family transcriptional regulator n=1 Tax=Massilia sp. ST3 TaxID=2824903 RepID=UPI001B81F437|nr:AraC family transcriptional regulator [Massilia sp. ST3]MBQ5948095.1 AraC family transcriptional regulator ligand-binding domain-containing protein [Massilia sp. ST3]